MSENLPRVRFAPSPTGMLHVGSAHTAQYNWLFAKAHGGTFILRIEDTDKAREDPAAEAAIYTGLRWLGMDWDEGPDKPAGNRKYRQSERLPIYQEAVQKLLASGAAYKSDKGDAGKGEAVLLRTSGRDVSYRDEIKGEITKPGTDIQDFVLARSNGMPLYNFCCAVDDHEMGITHVIRGEDGVENTFRQMLIYEAFGWTPPKFAHMPFIVNAEGKKYSKRDGAVSIEEFRREGYLPDALFNFLGLLGWSPGDGRELMGRGEFIEAFRNSFERTRSSGSQFDFDKLDHFNKHYLKSVPVQERIDSLLPYVEEAGFPAPDPAWFRRLVESVGERVTRYGGFVDQFRYFLDDDLDYDAKAVRKFLCAADARRLLVALAERIDAVDDAAFASGAGARTLETTAAEQGLAARDATPGLRVALTGGNISPPIEETILLLGRRRVVSRIRRGLAVAVAASAAETLKAVDWSAGGPALPEDLWLPVASRQAADVWISIDRERNKKEVKDSGLSRDKLNPGAPRNVGVDFSEIKKRQGSVYLAVFDRNDCVLRRKSSYYLGCEAVQASLPPVAAAAMPRDGAWRVTLGMAGESAISAETAAALRSERFCRKLAEIAVSPLLAVK
jgi:glutamyl-tRNA synthetase